MPAGYAEDIQVKFVSTDTPPYWSSSLPHNGLGGHQLQFISEAAGISESLEFLPIKRFRNSPYPFLVGDPDLVEDVGHHAVFPIGIFHTSFIYYTPIIPQIYFDNPGSLRGYRMAALSGSVVGKESLSRIGVRVEECESIDAVVRMLKFGRVDFGIVVSGSARFTIDRLFPGENKNFRLQNIGSLMRPIAIIVDKRTEKGRAVALRYQRVLEKVLMSPAYRKLLVDSSDEDEEERENHVNKIMKFVRDYKKTWEITGSGS